MPLFGQSLSGNRLHGLQRCRRRSLDPFVEGLCCCSVNLLAKPAGFLKTSPGQELDGPLSQSNRSIFRSLFCSICLANREQTNHTSLAQKTFIFFRYFPGLTFAVTHSLRRVVKASIDALEQISGGREAASNEAKPGVRLEAIR